MSVQKSSLIIILSMVFAVSAAHEAQSIFNVATFGAIGNGIHDDGPAIRKAIAAAIQAGPGSRVCLEPKTYRLKENTRSDTQFELANAQGITIEGNGARLINTPTNNLIRLRACRDMTVKGLVIDYDPLPFTQGTIININARTGIFDLALHENYPLPPTDAWVKARLGQAGWQWGCVIDPKKRHRRWDVQMHFFIQSVQPITGKARTYQIEVTPQFRKALSPVQPGDRFFLPLPYVRSEGRGGSMGTNFSVTACSDCVIEDITFYSARSGMVFGISHNEGKITLRKLNVRFKPDSDRVCTSWRDGIHSKDNRVGPVIEHCYFEGMLDDSINMGANTAMAREVRSDTEFVLTGASFQQGDQVLVWDPVTGQTLSNTTVTGLRRDRQGVVVTLQDAVTPVVVGQKRAHKDINSTHFYNLTRCGRGFIVRHCTFKPQRRHALLVRAPDGLIEDNFIDSVGGSAVVLGNETGSFYEGPFPNHTIVQNNTIRNTQGTAIHVYTRTKSRSAAMTRGVQIRNNTITVLPGKKGIVVEQARDVVVEGNVETRAQHGENTPFN